MHMFELICPYNSMWVCHCDWCVSEKVAIWPFLIFFCLLIEKLTDWCVLVCQRLTYGQIEPHMEDLGSDMEQEDRQPLNRAEETEKEERLPEHTQTGQDHHS